MFQERVGRLALVIEVRAVVCVFGDALAREGGPFFDYGIAEVPTPEDDTEIQRTERVRPSNSAVGVTKRGRAREGEITEMSSSRLVPYVTPPYR